MGRLTIIFILMAASVYFRGATAAENPKNSPELRVLEQFVGTWDEVMTNKPTDWMPEAQRFTSIIRRAWSLGGTFIRAEGTWQPAKTEGLHLMTYDPVDKVYRSWYFDAAGAMPRGSITGTWDENTRTMNWRGTDEAGNKTTGKHRFIDRDHHEWTYVITTPDGKAGLDLTGKSSRRKEQSPAR